MLLFWPKNDQGVYKAPQIRTKLRMWTTFAVCVPLKVRKFISGYEKIILAKLILDK